MAASQLVVPRPDCAAAAASPAQRQRPQRQVCAVTLVCTMLSAGRTAAAALSSAGVEQSAAAARRFLPRLSGHFSLPSSQARVRASRKATSIATDRKSCCPGHLSALTAQYSAVSGAQRAPRRMAGLPAGPTALPFKSEKIRCALQPVCAAPAERRCCCSLCGATQLCSVLQGWRATGSPAGACGRLLR